MNVKRSVLGHVSLLMLTDRLEDIAVEALGYILSNSEDARIALQEFGACVKCCGNCLQVA